MGALIWKDRVGRSLSSDSESSWEGSSFGMVDVSDAKEIAGTPLLE